MRLRSLTHPTHTTLSSSSQLRNDAGHSPTYEALQREKEEVASFLLDLEQDRAQKGRDEQETTIHNTPAPTGEEEDEEDEEIRISA